MDDCRDLGQLFYLLPFQKGYLVNWDRQKTVLDYAFSDACLNVKDMSKTDLILTEPYFNMASVQDGLDQLLFDEYGFKSVLRTNPADLACYADKLENPDQSCCLIVDCGFSFSHVAPFVNGRRVREAVLRIDVGGKMMTNHLKEIISYRQLNVMDETHVINSCREDCCYVSMDFDGDMEEAARARINNVARDYVLPDFTAIRRGFMKSSEASVGRPENDAEQIVRMNNERFTVPELLFNPSDVGLRQMGIPEAIECAVNRCPEEARRWLYANIVIIGGCAKTPNMKERVERDVRALAPAHYDVNVHIPEDPIGYAWKGGALLAKDPVYLKELAVSKAEYLEKGHAACQDKFYL